MNSLTINPRNVLANRPVADNTRAPLMEEAPSKGADVLHTKNAGGRVRRKEYRYNRMISDDPNTRTHN